MTDAARHDALYAAFAASMLAALAAEEDRIARHVDAVYVAATSSEDRNAATVRPNR